MNDYQEQKASWYYTRPEILEPGREARDRYDTKKWGANYYAITTEMLQAMIHGKQIALDSQGEYVVFICLEDTYDGD